ncbi:MAG TPA: hypothetical protein VG895_01490 [Patescibacteria group bacterium]|nr:hypothetical protein [Patescibacteria group bacterium]
MKTKEKFHKLHWIITIILGLLALILIIYILIKNNDATVYLQYQPHNIENFTTLNCNEFIENDFNPYTPDSSYYAIGSTRGNYKSTITVSRAGQTISLNFANSDSKPEIVQIDNETNQDISEYDRYGSLYISKINGYLVQTTNASAGPVQETTVYSCKKIN